MLPWIARAYERTNESSRCPLCYTEWVSAIDWWWLLRLSACRADTEWFINTCGGDTHTHAPTCTHTRTHTHTHTYTHVRTHTHSYNRARLIKSKDFPKLRLWLAVRGCSMNPAGCRSFICRCRSIEKTKFKKSLVFRINTNLSSASDQFAERSPATITDTLTTLTNHSDIHIVVSTCQSS